MADDRFSSSLRPRQLYPIVRKLVWMRNIKGRGKGRFFADQVEAEDLGDLDDFVTASGEVLQCDCAVTCAEINSEAKTCAHVIGNEGSFRASLKQTRSLEFDFCWGDRRQ